MSVNSAVGTMPGSFVSSLVYDSVKLPDLVLELDSETDDLLARIPDRPLYRVSDIAIKNLCGFLGIPYKFASTLKDDGKAYIIAYLQQQLSKAIEVPILYVSQNIDGEDTILSFTEKRLLPFRGMDSLELDNTILEMASKPDFPLELASRQTVNGEMQYLFLNKEPYLLTKDPSEKGVQPLWRWGYTFDYSLTGQRPAKFGTEIQRMICVNLTYLPDKIFGTTPTWKETTKENLEVVTTFFKDLPGADWRQIGRWIGRMTNVPASVSEMKTARRKLHSVLMSSKDDKETEERIDLALQWKRVVKEYGLDDKEFKPSKTWCMRASTPLSLFDLYNVVTREGTAAPNNIPFEERQGLLVYGGKMLAKMPDIAENPPEVDWKE